MEGIVFAVKGLVHPPDRVVAFPKYYPNLKGDRETDLGRYRKIAELRDFYRFLEKHHPYYLKYDPVFGETLSQVPYTSIAQHFSPPPALQRLLKSKEKLDVVEEDVKEMAIFLIEKSGLPHGNCGVSGSVMIRVHTTASDIDLVIYGKRNCKALYQTLKSEAGKSSPLQLYGATELRMLYNTRVKDTRIPLQQFLAVEHGKLLQGKFRGRDYFIRLVKHQEEFGETYGDRHYTAEGFVEMKAVVTEDEDSIFTPCKYGLGDVTILKGAKVENVKEVTSFRGRFCEQVERGDRVFVRGKLEKVKFESEHYRVVVGNRPQDYIIPTKM